ncbi:MAG: toll/interleukin-1 receptor domain-containing protein [Methylococcaceae bacterium]|nr:toll/interleukin-1 receptor domain-containing protein [Methylococcaceae bacterium]
MSRIFLSHSSFDEIEAVALKHWLADNGWGDEDVFLDVDPERGLAVGERWQEALRKAADRCEAVLFVVSPAWAKSKWCLAEFLLAKNLHKLIFWVVLKEVPIDELPTEMIAEWQLCQLGCDGPKEIIQFSHRQHEQKIPFLVDGLKRLKLVGRKPGSMPIFSPGRPNTIPIVSHTVACKHLTFMTPQYFSAAMWKSCEVWTPFAAFATATTKSCSSSSALPVPENTRSCVPD